MSRDATARLAKAAWMLPLLFVFGRGFVSPWIGPALADLLVFVFAVAAIPVAIYCLIRTRTHGARGIRGHAVAGVIVSALLLAIWIPNFLSARERARAADENRPVVNVHVSRDGVLRMNGAVVPFDTVKAELQRMAAVGGVMWYSRDDPAAEPHPNAMAVMKAAADLNVTIQMMEPR